jgi:hypothetical protein
MLSEGAKRRLRSPRVEVPVERGDDVGMRSVGADMSGVDYLEVSRTAHQVVADHGPNAHGHAARLSQEAGAARKLDEAALRKAVAAALRPRR